MNNDTKNKLIRDYAYNLVNQMKQQYGNIIKDNQIDEIISIYNNSDKEIKEIQKEIYDLLEDFIRKYLEEIQKNNDEITKIQIENQDQLMQIDQQIENIPDVSQSTNIKKIAKVIQMLNPNADIRIGNPAMMSDANNKIFSSIPIENIKLPKGFEYNDKNGITNKYKTGSGVYTSLEVASLNGVNQSMLMPKSEQLKSSNENIVNKETVQNTNQQVTKNIKSEHKNISKVPSITSQRKKQKNSKKINPMKMTNIESKMYPLLNEKRKTKLKQKTQTKTTVMTYKKPKNPMTNQTTSSKGFINLIFASLILLTIVFILFILNK